MPRGLWRAVLPLFCFCVSLSADNASVETFVPRASGDERHVAPDVVEVQGALADRAIEGVRVLVDGQVVFDGRLDTTAVALSATARRVIRVEARDKDPEHPVRVFLKTNRPAAH